MNLRQYRRPLLCAVWLLLGVPQRTAAEGPESALPSTRALAGRVLGPYGPAERCLVQIAQASPRSDNGFEALDDTETDGQGRFIFTDLPPARYEIRVYRSDLGDAGANLVGGDATISLETSDVKDLELRISTPGSLSGVVLDDSGAPVFGAAVVASTALRQLSGINGSGRIWVTDEKGRFRIAGLPPGDYFVGAHFDDDIATFLLQAPKPKNPIRKRLAFTLYPGAADLAHARTVHVAENAETDVRLIMARRGGTSIEGELIGLDPGDKVSLSLHVEGDDNTLQSNVQENGLFRFTNVLPGRYTIDAGSAFLWGDYSISESLEVPEDGVRGLKITAHKNSPIVEVPGTLRFAGKRNQNVSPITTPLECPKRFVFSQNKVEDGHFTMRVAEPMHYRFELQTGWIVKQMLVDGLQVDPSDVLVTPQTSLVEITAAEGDSTPPSITGEVVDAAGEPVRNAAVLLVQSNHELWCAESVLAASSDQDGRFLFSNLPNKRYQIVALPSLHWSDLSDKNAWKLRYEKAATDIQLVEHEKKVVTLNIISF